MELKDGYMLVVHSWENDYDNHRTNITTGIQDKETLKSLINVLETIKKINKQDDLSFEEMMEIYNSIDEHYLKFYNYSDKPIFGYDYSKYYDDLSDFLTNIYSNWDLLPEWEGYTVRIVDSIEISHIEVIQTKLKIEDLFTS